MEPVDLTAFLSDPAPALCGAEAAKRLERVRQCPSGEIAPWGLRFVLPGPKSPPSRGARRATAVGRSTPCESAAPRAVVVQREAEPVVIPLGRNASHLCFVHEWVPASPTPAHVPPREGLHVGEYVLRYADGSSARQPIRARYEVWLPESPGPSWLAVPLPAYEPLDPTKPRADIGWGQLQYGARSIGGVP